VGPTHVRLLVPLSLAAGLLVSDCGTERPTATLEADPSFSSAPTPTAKPTRQPKPPRPTEKPPPAPELEGPLANFPLALGYDTENGDDHSPVVVTGKPTTRAFTECGRQVWDPMAGSTDVIGVEWRGEAEWFLGRTLVLYPSVEGAAATVTAAHDALAACQDDPAEPGYGTTHTLLDIPLGDTSVVWADTYWFISDGDKLHDTGLTVYSLVRVGRAVLLAYEYGEGNGSEQSRQSAITRAVKADRPVVDAMGAVR
jgi:hypothetical protein